MGFYITFLAFVVLIIKKCFKIYFKFNLDYLVSTLQPNADARVHAFMFVLRSKSVLNRTT